MKIGISACLLGHNVRYDGSNKRNEELLKLLERHEIIAVCPEISSGFPVPHEPLEIKGDKVIDPSGNDLSNKLHEGSLICLNKIKECDLLILKSKSPSCGHGLIYDGSFSGRLVEGEGVFTSMCLQNNLKIYSENDLEILKTILA